MAGKLFIISGPSGVGKGTLIDALLERVPELHRTVSCTTREQRPSETDGIDYNFMNEDTFESSVRVGAFLEWAEVHGNRYGTLRAEVRRMLDAGEDILLEIDTRGAKQVKRAIPEAILIFIGVGNMDELRRRLEKRGTETPEQIEIRMQTTVEEMKRCDNYNVMIINDDFTVAVDKLVATVRGYLD